MRYARERRVAAFLGIVTLLILAFVFPIYWPVVRSWWLLKKLGQNAQGYQEYLHRPTGIVFVLLPGGTFRMGSCRSETDSRDNEWPPRELTVKGFYIAKYEVSQGEWEKVMKQNPSTFKDQSLPVDSVSWNDCEEFCKKTGLSLPTEAQWEYACRAGTSTPYAFGDELCLTQTQFSTGSSSVLEKIIGIRPKTSPVQSGTPNRFGIHHMHGNVQEWCKDLYLHLFRHKQVSTKHNSAFDSEKRARTIRGGYWGLSAEYCRSAARFGRMPTERDEPYGFRPVYVQP